MSLDNMNGAVKEVLDEGKSVMLSPKQEVFEGTPRNDPNRHPCKKNALDAEAAGEVEKNRRKKLNLRKTKIHRRRGTSVLSF